MFRKLLFIAIGLSLSISLSAQDPEPDVQILTEDSVPIEDFYINGVVKRSLIDESPILQYDQPREADVVWERKLTRIIDVREKRNQVFRSPHKPFFVILREMAENGDVAVFRDEFRYYNCL